MTIREALAELRDAWAALWFEAEMTTNRVFENIMNTDVAALLTGVAIVVAVPVGIVIFELHQEWKGKQ